MDDQLMLPRKQRDTSRMKAIMLFRSQTKQGSTPRRLQTHKENQKAWTS